MRVRQADNSTTVTTRIPAGERAVAEVAADVEGQSLSRFTAQAVRERAERAILEAEVDEGGGADE